MFDIELWRLRRRSLKLLLRPTEFVEPEKIPDGFNLDEWRQDFFWVEERKISAVKPISMTLEEMRGDCEDFAAVAVASMKKNNFDTVSYGFFWREGQLLPTHVTANGVQNEEPVVYSNGQKWLMGPEEWKDETGYARAWVQEV